MTRSGRRTKSWFIQLLLSVQKVQVCDATGDAMLTNSPVHKTLLHLSLNVLVVYTFLIKYQYSTKSGYCKC
jgi:hypothetical protein